MPAATCGNRNLADTHCRSDNPKGVTGGDPALRESSSMFATITGDDDHADRDDALENYLIACQYLPTASMCSLCMQRSQLIRLKAQEYVLGMS